MKTVLLSKISQEQSKLDERDVEGHIWWGKFRDIVDEIYRLSCACDVCRFNVFESDGGDGNPAIYCDKGHWSGYDATVEPPSNEIISFDNCPDFCLK